MAAVPLVSVVIPTYNGERHLGETIESVRGQTFESWELVVYDDGSTDATIEVVRCASSGDARVRVVGGANGGVARARNAGFACTDARTRFVVFLDHDDMWDPEMLETVVGALDAHPEHVAAHAIATCIDEHGNQYVDDDLETFMRHRSGMHEGQLRAAGAERTDDVRGVCLPQLDRDTRDTRHPASGCLRRRRLRWRGHPRRRLGHGREGQPAR